jgi:SacI homology domain
VSSSSYVMRYHPIACDGRHGDRIGVRPALRSVVRTRAALLGLIASVVSTWRFFVVPVAAAASPTTPTRVTGYGSRAYQKHGKKNANTLRPHQRSSKGLSAADTRAVLESEASKFRATLRVRILTSQGDGDEEPRSSVLQVRRVPPTYESDIVTAASLSSCDGAIISSNEDGSLRLQPMQSTSPNVTSILSNDDDDYDNNNNHDEEVPVEGLFGVYAVPSGRLWVWIAESELVYDAPRLGEQQQKQPPHRSWFEIRKVTQLYLTHQQHCAGNVPSRRTAQSTLLLRRAQRLEEMRQVALLRQALKHHDWYFCGGAGLGTNVGGVDAPPRVADSTDGAALIAPAFVPDMTVNLQAALLCGAAAAAGDSTTLTHLQVPPPWWMPNGPTARNHTASRLPVSRFFWNQALLEELVRIQEFDTDANDEELQHQRDACRFLLEHSIPVTSAFCGVQRNVSIHSGNVHSAGNGPVASGYYDHLLITRRSRFRAGTRFTKRGADHTGAVANYAETEQIVLIHDGNNHLRRMCSHVQTRGSIPLRWSSPTDIKTYRPRVRIGTDPIAQARAVRQHVVDQMSTYVLPKKRLDSPAGVRPRIHHPELVFVNLVDKKSDQGRLGRAFDAVLTSVIDVYAANDSSIDNRSASMLNGSAARDASVIPLNFSNVQHIWYDFHAEVKHGRWGRLSHLLKDVKGTLREHGYFQATPLQMKNRSNGEDSACLPLVQIERCQSGVVRTNCMDCLDRTNVVQGLFGRFLLFRQLSDAKLLPLSFKTAFQAIPLSLPWNEGEVAHRHLWADNADAISRLYAGTPALKGDFTRTGRRTKRGALDDGMNSLQRYYLNNFQDADRQEGVDLLVGFQPFTIVSNDTEVSGADDHPTGAFTFHGISLQEAAHRAVLGSDADQVEGDGDHVRIKVSRRRRSGKFALLAQSTPHLDLRWLPGDLQTQMRGLISPDVTNAAPSLTLQSLESRSKLEQPWWVTSGSFSDEEDASTQNQNVADAEVAALNNPGYLMGAVVAGSQSPFMMATVVLAILVSSFPSTIS